MDILLTHNKLPEKWYCRQINEAKEHSFSAKLDKIHSADVCPATKLYLNIVLELTGPCRAATKRRKRTSTTGITYIYARRYVRASKD